MLFIIEWWQSALASVFQMAWVLALVRSLEMISPKTPVSAVSQVRSLLFWPIFLGSVAAFYTAGGIIWSRFGIYPLFEVDAKNIIDISGLRWVNYVVWPICAVIVNDFFHYWKHRVQHRYFWKQHSMHHSIEELSAINSYRHWTDALFSLLLVAIPMASIVHIDLNMYVITAMLIAMNGEFIHSNSKVNWGVLNRVFVDNRMHRIHHSIERCHYDKNFGETTTIWDQIFGTAYFPDRTEWPQTGVEGCPEPRTYNDYLWRPFRRHKVVMSNMAEASTDGVSRPLVLE
jgi:sterol desaturase/sphingolipid hydroxylase (fatty acid hydroxylase superfamily)